MGRRSFNLKQAVPFARMDSAFSLGHVLYANDRNIDESMKRQTNVASNHRSKRKEIPARGIFEF